MKEFVLSLKEKRTTLVFLLSGTKNLL